MIIVMTKFYYEEIKNDEVIGAGKWHFAVFPKVVAYLKPISVAMRNLYVML